MTESPASKSPTVLETMYRDNVLFVMLMVAPVAVLVPIMLVFQGKIGFLVLITTVGLALPSWYLATYLAEVSFYRWILGIAFGLIVYYLSENITTEISHWWMVGIAVAPWFLYAMLAVCFPSYQSAAGTTETRVAGRGYIGYRETNQGE